MANSHSSHHNHRTLNKPNLGLSQQNFENLMMGSSRGFHNVATSSNSAVHQEDHSWQTEQTLNLDDFDDKDFNLVNYIAADSNTPLEEMGHGLDMDEIERQKIEAQYTQMNYLNIFPEQQQHEFRRPKEHDFVPNINDFANVPDFTGEAEQDMEIGYQHEEISPLTHRTTSKTDYTPRQINQNLNKVILTPSTSRASAVNKPLNRIAIKPEIIKEEPSEHQEEFVSLSLTGGSTSSRASSISSNPLYATAASSMSDKISTKPRKYRIKPESEKLNPQYRAKRLKNNDAVRRSREKARKQQEAKETRLQQLEDEVTNQAQIITEQEAQIVQLRNEIVRLKQKCRCGTAASKYHR